MTWTILLAVLVVAVLVVATRAVNAADVRQETARPDWMELHVAAMNSDIARIASLLDRGGDIDDRHLYTRMTPLHTAIQSRLLETTRYLVERGADMNARALIREVDPQTGEARVVGSGNTPLHMAAIMRSPDILQFLLEAGADPNLGDAEGNTALAVAAQQGDLGCVCSLLTATPRADPNIASEHGAVPLHAAAERGFDEITRLLLAHGARVDVPTRAHGDTPLHDAALHGHQEVTRLLLAHGADVNRRELLGNTPLHLAAYGGFPGVVQQLLAHGADPSATNGAGFTAADLACEGPVADPGSRELILQVLGEGVRRPPAELAARAGQGDDAAPSSGRRYSYPLGPRPSAPPPEWPDLADLVEELVAIGRRTGFFGVGYGRTRAIGEHLNDVGGRDLMRRVHEIVSLKVERSEPRKLEVVWDGIGEWQG